MDLIEYINRRHILSAFLCLGISGNPLLALADAQRGQQPLQGSALREVVAATMEAGEASNDAAVVKAAPAPAATATPIEQAVATVNGKPITVREFNALYAETIRKRFWHGAPPEGQAKAVRKEVIDLMIEDELLVEEAGRRGFKPDEARIEEIAASMEARYGAMPEWKTGRDQALSLMREQVSRPGLIEQARKALRDVPQPPPAEVRAFYDQKPELFTEPEKLRLSVILLKVDPGAPVTEWDKAREEAQGIYLRIKGGADFAELARKHSNDVSADSGGDLGYVHGGMLPEKLQGKIDKLQVGVVTEPLTVLEGVALYRLDERVAPVLRQFAEVEQRAQGLLKREQEAQAWKEAIGRLRGEARIEILAPLPDDSSKQSGRPAGAQLIAPEGSGKQSDSSRKKSGKKMP